ncbi:MAG TPA: 50S ribosomal protein L18 [Patescibacteria group bacterium]
MKSNRQKIKQQIRQRRHGRVRSKVFGTAQRPRLSVFRSLKYISGQLIDDGRGETLASVFQHDLKQAKGAKTELAREVGKLLAQKAQAKGIKKVVFDRGPYKYHGRVKALADGVREGGLEF